MISLPQILTDLEICHLAFLYIFFSYTCLLGPTAAVILVLSMGCPVITKLGDFSTFDSLTVAKYLSE